MFNLSHIGIAVRNLNQAVETYSVLLQKEPDLINEVSDQKVRVAIFKAKADSNSPSIELLEPLSADSPISRFLDKRGEGLHHIALSVSDIEATLAHLKEKGFRLIDETPRRGSEGHKIAFLHPLSFAGVLIELEEI